MKLQFDSEQEYQLDAIKAVVDLFDGQALGTSDFEIALPAESQDGEDLFSSLNQTALGVGNNLILGSDALLENLQHVQEHNDLVPDDDLLPMIGDPEAVAKAPASLNFSVEMETGTGKTYVYLRTIYELAKRYGFRKFIIVVPSVAIREGVLKSIEITTEHLQALYNNIPVEHFVYDGKRVNRMRSYAQSTTVQIMVINIDAFRKNFADAEDEAQRKKSNLMYKDNDKLSGWSPIQYVRATNPIVIIDEPQSVDNTEKAQEAIRALNPMCTLRYSATHTNPYNLVYKLDPIRAYSLRLVKQIVVSSITTEGGFNDSYVRVKDIGYAGKAKTPHAKIELDVQEAEGVKKKSFTIKGGEDLYTLSNERAAYRDGFIVDYVDATPDSEHIAFTNGKTITIGQEIGGVQGDVQAAQIKSAVEKHLEKELKMSGRGIKVLSLFFIDRVANYRDSDSDGNSTPGKFAITFEAVLKELLARPRFANIAPLYAGTPVEKLHNGYFAQDKKGGFKDTSGKTQADDDVYSLIMKDKERLLSQNEPLRFIFSHSALREGWDNPNVFQICTLNETQSTRKKRQEIGRGLRLPVNQDGQRVFDDAINILHVVANESYEDFARALQTEYEDDCGVTFGKVPRIAFAKLTLLVDDSPVEIGRLQSFAIWDGLVSKGVLDTSGKITEHFNSKATSQQLGLPEAFTSLRNDVIDVLEDYQLDRHIKRDGEEIALKVNKQVLLDANFKDLWDRIKPKTNYAVYFESAELIKRAVRAIKELPNVSLVRIRETLTEVELEKRGVGGLIRRDTGTETLFRGALPDILAYLQDATELTRGTLTIILQRSQRLDDFIVNPQAFMDAVATCIHNELHRLMIDGIKYERIAGEEYAMQLFEEKEVISYLTNRYEMKNVEKNVYDAVVYDSNVEREFAEALDARDDIKLFVKLPWWFKVETPLGTYNPDWAIMKHNDQTLYLVRETKGTKDFEKLRTIEADKIRCGRQHFAALGTVVSFDVVINATEI